ncbi:MULTISPECIES: FecCD family ABC transporter permease [Paenibacillus]|uniref:Iron ABC transporter permease n=1 Tax=Paenibacillus agri TaxID=2744309 RepID=A0A850EW24_9BACL|nr:iron ABC transporter permease [Paenibacillus agri]NUU63664.1 iron ABC transporter permease [Paenibacillus agri]
MSDIGLKKEGEARKAPPLWLVFSIFGVILLAIAAVTLSYRVKGLTWSTLFSTTNDEVLTYTLWSIRAPRLLLSIILGAGLAVAGCLLQSMTRNPLSDPEILGINQGASCFAVIAIVGFGERDSSTVILLASLCGAGAIGLLISWLSRYSGNDASRLMLAGVAISAFMGALTTGFILLFETQLIEILYWMAGKLTGTTWSDNKLVWALDIPALIVAFLLARTLNLLGQGEELATGLGVNVPRVRQLIGVLIVVLTGSAVAVAGPIGFIGLMVPHMAKRLGGLDHKVILPLSAIMGAVLLSAADFLSQWLTYPADLPVGIITAFMGVPFFLYLLRRQREGHR